MHSLFKKATVIHDFRSLEVTLIGGTHFPAFEGLWRPEVVFHAHPLILFLSTEQERSEFAQLQFGETGGQHFTFCKNMDIVCVLC